MIPPKMEYIQFKNLDEKLEKLKEFGLISPKAEEVKDLFYKGTYVKEPVKCDVVGLVSDINVVIKIDQQLHCIHPAYLKDMQKKDFDISNLE